MAKTVLVDQTRMSHSADSSRALMLLNMPATEEEATSLTFTPLYHEMSTTVKENLLTILSTCHQGVAAPIVQIVTSNILGNNTEYSIGTRRNCTDELPSLQVELDQFSLSHDIRRLVITCRLCAAGSHLSSSFYFTAKATVDVTTGDATVVVSHDPS